MRIIRLSAENFKRLRAVEIEPDGNVVVIRGRNAQGKTSVMDAIAAALGGKDLCPEKPIRDGEDRAEITVDLGEYIITRTFTAKDSYLTVRNADGAKIANPQALLDGLIGKISFDPLDFTRTKPADQVKLLAEITGVDFTKLNVQRSGFYSQRTEVNKTVTRCKARLTVFEQEHGKPDLSILDTADQADVNWMAEYERANAEHVKLGGLKNDVRNIATGIATTEQRIEALRAEIMRLEEWIELSKVDLHNANERVVEAEKNLPDLEAIKRNMAEQRERQATVSRAKEYRLISNDLALANDESQQLTDQIETIDRQKAELVANADLPVNNLTFDENGVYYQGVPFAQCSSSEQLKVSTALAIALNPKLRVIKITDGSLLDSESMAVLEAVAGARDFQIWIERVDDSEGGVGIRIEDGAVAEPVAEEV